MRRRSNLLVILGIAFFVVGGIIVYLLTDDDGDSVVQARSSSAVVGTEDIPAGALADELIEQGVLQTVEVESADLVPGAVQSLNQLAGATFVQGFAAEQQITGSGLQLQNRTFEIPEGFEAVSVQLEFVAGAAGYVNPGDRINLYGFFSGALADAVTPRAELLLTNVEVLDVDLSIPARRGTTPSDPSQPSGQRASGETVTYLLALRTDDAEKVIFTTQFEGLYATLTADDAPPAGATPGRDPGTILSEEPDAAFNS